ncbi:MOSC domain-containing protein [Limnochorda pilosa]|uniref:MOSC domain-containing protein n=1 Tax=Limnochorda pilosa TaxID=1555112 RepID=UPI0038B40F59
MERMEKERASPRATRRNLVTRDVPLNHLVGRTFRVGEVQVGGLRLCGPCGHPARLLASQRVTPGLVPVTS